MGYTHYWERQKRYSRPVFNRICSDMQKLDKSRRHEYPRWAVTFGGKEVILDRGTSNRFVKANDLQSGLLCFNGKDQFAHEDFYFQRVMGKINSVDQQMATKHPTKTTTKMYFQFCKTAQKPYDLMVCASLLIMKYHLGDDIIVKSDGSPEDWEHAKDFICERLDRPLITTWKDGVLTGVCEDEYSGITSTINT